jgi:predicted HicB family RNase H-like nuclease
MHPSHGAPQFNVRLTPELKDWITKEAKRNAASMNSEIVRAIAERRDRVIAERRDIRGRAAAR